ncbi:MAG: hypothetical protein ND895_17110 [Pyrinomonadaceae bacterium]|nr:hypothetical protein [Pyrinomonadaceae bacterium]
MKYLLLVLTLFLTVLFVIGNGPQQVHQNDKVVQADEASKRFIDEQLPIVDFNSPKPSEPAARAKRLAKDRRHNLRKQPIGERLTGMTTVYHWPADFPPLPVEESTTIIVGQVSEAKAHISEDRSGVYSEVVVKIQEVLKDTVGIPAAIVAEREGGRVRFPSGTVFRYFVDGLGIPKVNHRYLLFLKQLDDGDFSILTGYQLLYGRVEPLDVTSVVPFAQYKDSDEMTFLSEVRKLLTHL